MNMTCNDRERIFVDGTAEEWAALEVHAAGCEECNRELEGWKSLSVAAGQLHREWESPNLWPRIEKALAERARPSSWWGRLVGSMNLASLQWQTAVAALLLVALTASAVWVIGRRPAGPKIPGGQAALLNNRAVREVERAEVVYEQAIEKLDAEAQPQLENPATPIIASYREKLQVLDSAIAELKSEAGMNPANGHLRRQLLAMYQEKQDTLEQVLEAKQ